MTHQPSPSNASEIVQAMWDNDLFSQWLGIERNLIAPGEVKLSMLVRPEMCNGFGIAHGAITYALADSALAFASNSRGRKALSIETSISHLRPVYPGDILIATTHEKHVGGKTGIYEVIIQKSGDKTVALFKGTVFYND